jgi:hypothetical protein
MIWRHSSAPGRCDLFMPASMPARHIRKKDAVYTLSITHIFGHWRIGRGVVVGRNSSGQFFSSAWF